MKFGSGILAARLAVIAVAYSSKEGDVSVDDRLLEYDPKSFKVDCA